MAEEKAVYKCNLCGNVVEVLSEGAGVLTCCGKAMEKLEEKTAEASVEKHMPFIERKENTYVVKVGENELHPMNENHFIKFIELNADGVVYRKNLKPGEEPVAVFEIPKAEKVSAREYCTLHGLWKN